MSQYYNVPVSSTCIQHLFQRNELGSMLIVNQHEQILQTNMVLHTTLSYTTQELQRMKLSQLIEGELSLEDLIALFRESEVNKTKFPQLMVKKKDGGSIRTDYAIFPLCAIDDEAGNNTNYLLILYDVRFRRPLSLLQQFSDTFIKDVNLGVMLIDLEFKLIDISDMACRILGVEKEQVMNKAMEEVFSNVPVEHQLVQRTILDGQVVRNHAISWTNGEERYELLMDSNLLKDDQGNIAGAYVMFKDVSNLRSLEEQVQRSDRLAMIGQIAAGTAHEIRNPLTSIKGFLQVLKKTLQDQGLDKEFNYTEIMLKEIDRINELVSEFLLLSKPKNISYHTVNVSAVIREILPIINNEAILHGVSVQYEASCDMPEVVADRELLKQVCLNICKNGIEAMTDGGVMRVIEKIDHEENEVSIEIHDTGPGIPAFLIDKIFDPFFTTKENGTGLGLSVCQRIIHDIGGTIRVSSKGFGTIFKINIPYSKD